MSRQRTGGSSTTSTASRTPCPSRTRPRSLYPPSSARTLATAPPSTRSSPRLGSRLAACRRPGRPPSPLPRRARRRPLAPPRAARRRSEVRRTSQGSIRRPRACRCETGRRTPSPLPKATSTCHRSSRRRSRAMAACRRRCCPWGSSCWRDCRTPRAPSCRAAMAPQRRRAAAGRPSRIGRPAMATTRTPCPSAPTSPSIAGLVQRRQSLPCPRPRLCPLLARGATATPGAPSLWAPELPRGSHRPSFVWPPGALLGASSASPRHGPRLGAPGKHRCLPPATLPPVTPRGARRLVVRPVAPARPSGPRSRRGSVPTPMPSAATSRPFSRGAWRRSNPRCSGARRVVFPSSSRNAGWS
mmetsp:Transcript_85257/g.246475  ORF Transcript_85257/g.246475 Transcript_85257/m.246475 type:complete len:357 (-) Transcript_85257:1121-2191(-)